MSGTLEFLGRQQVLTELVAEINVEFSSKSTFPMHEVAEMEIDKFPLWVMFTSPITEILQEISLEFCTCRRNHTVHSLPTRTAATDGFSLLSHTSLEVLFQLVLRIDINAKAIHDG